MINDFLHTKLSSGEWLVTDTRTLESDMQLECDVIIVGTGAGGGVSAEILAKAGLNVIMLEEGPFKTSKDFDMLEKTAYPSLYQESASRKTKDKAITILQGRGVGGTTTVNWTSSFRTPPETLEHWQQVYQTKGLDEATLAPWFDVMETRLNISRWQIPPNPNNEALRRAATKLNYSYEIISRNVKDCWNLGYCGLGCPINAKQSMLVTTIPAALDHKAQLYHHAKVTQLIHNNTRVNGIEAIAVDGFGKPLQHKLQIRAKQVILAAGSIGTPTILMRSNTPDPHLLAGKRTFLHPTIASMGIMPNPIRPFSGAPQSVYSDHFLWSDGVDGAMGYKLEVPPLHPVITSTLLPFHGQTHTRLMKHFANAQALIALGRDGFHIDSPAGQVHLREDGSPQLDYRLNIYFWKMVRKAFLTMAESQFAAGARGVMPLHADAGIYRSWFKAKAAINDLSLKPLKCFVASAHVMGGSPMGENKKATLINSEGEHHYLKGLYVFDGSMFPTSLGANPQLSIFAIVAKNASLLADKLSNTMTSKPTHQEVTTP